jgi:hypothetical protein
LVIPSVTAPQRAGAEILDGMTANKDIGKRLKELLAGGER